MPELQAGLLEDLTAGKAFLYLDNNYLFHFGPGKNLDYILFLSSGKVFGLLVPLSLIYVSDATAKNITRSQMLWSTTQSPNRLARRQIVGDNLYDNLYHCDNPREICRSMSSISL